MDAVLKDLKRLTGSRFSIIQEHLQVKTRPAVLHALLENAGLRHSFDVDSVLTLYRNALSQASPPSPQTIALASKATPRQTSKPKSPRTRSPSQKQSRPNSPNRRMTVPTPEDADAGPPADAG